MSILYILQNACLICQNLKGQREREDTLVGE